MAKHNSLTELFTATANAIRSKTGSTDPIVADDFPAAIEGIEAGGGGSVEDLDGVLTEQERLVSTLQETLDSKASAAPVLNTKTCTVNIVPPSNSNYYVARETVNSNGTISYAITRSYTAATITQTVRCDSIMYIQASTIKSAEASDGEILYTNSGYGITYKTPSLGNSVVQITLNG